MAVFLPSDTSTIRYEETDLASLHSRPSHFVCGVYLICVRGTAVVSTGVQQYALGEQTELIFLTGSLIQVLCASDDFMVRLLMFPKDVFLKAVLPIDTPYLNYTHEHPCYRHTEDERSQATWLQINLWMDMAQMLFCGNVSPFRQQQEYNFLQGLLMWLFNTIHPRWSMAIGLNWAKHSRLKRADGKEPPYMGEDKECLVQFAKEYMKSHPQIDYFIFGHRHIELDLILSRKSRLMIIGDWITQFTYAVFDGEHMFLEEYVEGESRP